PMRSPTRWAAALLLLGACGPPAPVAWPERSSALVTSRKKTLAAGEAAIRAAMGAPGVRRVEAPGNEEPVMIDKGCVNGAWFTVDGAAKGGLGEGFQYSWHLCVGDDEKYVLQVNCLEVKKTEASVDSHECAGGRVAREVARRSDGIAASIAS